MPARNLVAGLVNAVGTSAINLVLVPFYLRLLGLETYGLIGFFAALQGFLSVLDLGLTPTMVREVARCRAAGRPSEARRLLHTLAVIYGSVAMLIGGAIVLAAPWLATDWLKSSSLPVPTLEHAIALMGIVIAVRWPMGVYNGALYGADKLAEASVIGLVMVVLTGIGALVVLEFVSPTIEAFFIAQTIGSILFLIVVRHAAWRGLGGRRDATFDAEALRRIWRFSAGLGITAIAGVVFTQADKLLLGKYASLDQLALYALAGLVARTLGVIAAPTFNVLYPRLTALYTIADHDGLLRTYKLGTRALMTICFAIAAFVGIFAQELVLLWTNNAALSLQVAPLIQLVMWGTVANTAMVFPYALQLAAGRSDVAARISVALLLIAIPTILALVFYHGATGAAIAWAAVNTLYLLLGPWFTHRFILPGQALAWIREDVGIPFLCSAVIVVGGGLLAKNLIASMWGGLFSGAILSACAVGAVIVITPQALTWVIGFIKRLDRNRPSEERL